MGQMKISQQQLHGSGDALNLLASDRNEGHLVLVFGSTQMLEDPSLHGRLKKAFPGAVLAGCSTSGEITAAGVEDDSMTVTSLEFSKTKVRTHRILVESMADSWSAGAALVKALYNKDLAYLLVLSNGLAVNGSALVSAIRDSISMIHGSNGIKAGRPAICTQLSISVRARATPAPTSRVFPTW